MKKKGLIISTIVMVVVLIASLTTATYAWFNASSFASVDQIALNVGAASSVAIGVNRVAITNENKTSQASYMSGAVEFDGTKWISGSDVLGSTVSTGLTLNITSAVGSGASGYKYTAAAESALISGNYIELSGNEYVWKDGNTANTTLWTFNAGNSTYVQVNTSTAYSSSTTYYTRAAAAREMDATYNAAHSLYKALGDSFATLQDPEDAIINGYTTSYGTDTDVLDLQMAINPVKSGIYGTFCVITIKPNGNYIGMASAIWVDITTPTNSATGIDLFDLLTQAGHWDTSNAGGANGYQFYFMIDPVSTEMTANDSTVTPFSLRLFIAGYDEDCVRSATGTGATIDIQFFGVTKDGSSRNVYGDGEYDADTLTNATAITGFAKA